MKNPAFFIFSISGISFWFFLGFPFANYHESYEWIAQVETRSAWDLLFSYVGHYESYRPLGQVIAIFLYKNIAPSMVSIQIFNYIFSILGILLILKSNSEKTPPLYLTYFLIGSLFFTTFNYLFHLNGLFYSPLALLLGILYYFSLHEYSSVAILKIYFVALISALFHPFALVITIAFLGGWTFENKSTVSKRIITLLVILISSMIILYSVLVKEPLLYLALINLSDIHNVFSSLENNLFTLIFSFLSTIVTAYTISTDVKSKFILIIVSIFLSVLFVVIKMPILFLVVLLGLIKLILKKKWSLASLLFILVLFPLIAGRVSDGLKFLILYILPLAITMDLKWTGYNFQDYIRKVIIAVPVTLCIVLILLKLNVQLPIISRLVKPLLTEREKSFQLENAIKWLIQSGDRNYSVEFLASDTNKKFPASNTNINNYLERINPITPGESLKVFICFDCDSLSTNNTLYSAEGLYSRNIRIIRP